MCFAKKWTVLTAAFFVFAVSGCGGDGLSEPRQVVISFFGAMEKDDQAALARMLDIPALMKNTNTDYALQGDSPRVFTNPRDILEDLTGSGLTKERWFSLQRIINDSEVIGETATVEVTFVDKDASKGYRTKFGLQWSRKSGKFTALRSYRRTNY